MPPASVCASCSPPAACLSIATGQASCWLDLPTLSIRPSRPCSLSYSPFPLHPFHLSPSVRSPLLSFLPVPFLHLLGTCTVHLAVAYGFVSFAVGHRFLGVAESSWPEVKSRLAGIQWSVGRHSMAGLPLQPLLDDASQVPARCTPAVRAACCMLSLVAQARGWQTQMCCQSHYF